MPFNELEVTVGANIRGLRSGLRQGNRAQQNYARQTERTFGGMHRRLARQSSLAMRAGVGGVLGAAGLGLGGAAAFRGITQRGNQFNRMTELQRRTLTDGQRQFREFAGAIAHEANRLGLILEDRLGMLLGPGRGNQRMAAFQNRFEEIMRGFVARTPIGAVRRGQDMGAITRVAEAQRGVEIRKRLLDMIRAERERAVRPSPPGAVTLPEFEGGVRAAVRQSPVAAGIQAAESAAFREAGRTIRGVTRASGPMGQLADRIVEGIFKRPAQDID